MKTKVLKLFRYITQFVLLASFKLRKIYKPSLLSPLKIESLNKKSVYSLMALVIFLLVTALVVPSLGVKTTNAVGITKYARSTGGNWSADATWSTTSNGAADTVKPTASDDVIFDNFSGAVTIDAASVAKTVVFNGGTGYTNTLTHNAFTLTVSGSITFVSTMTYAPLATSTVVMAATGTLTTGTKLMPLVNSTAGTMTLGDNLSFMASQVMKFTLSGTAVDLNGKTVSGNSNINRLLIQSSVIGTAKGITVSAGTFAYADFQDIVFNNGGADLHLEAITGLSGDCGGNSMSGGGVLTFTTTSAQTFASTSGSWSDVAKWTSRIPLPQDTARFQAMSAAQTITVDMPRLPDTNFSGATNTPTVLMTTTGMTYNWYGSINLTGVGTFTSNKWNQIISRTNVTITSATKTITSNIFYIYVPNATLTLADAFVCTTNIRLYLGTLTTNYAVTTGYISTMPGTTVNMGSGLWTLTGSGIVWSSAAGINAQTSTIALTYTGATASSFAGGAAIYNNITIAPGSGVLTFSGAFTFANMTMSSAGVKTIIFTKNTTYTVTGTNFLSGTAGNLVTISSNTAGTAFTLSKSSGAVFSDYLSLKDSAATGGAGWFAGPLTHSTNVSGNTGWLFKTPIYISNAGGNWSSASAWTAGVVPTSADVVMATATSGNLTIDSAAFSSSLDLSSYLGTLTHNAGVTLSVGDAYDGSLKFGAGMTYTPLNNTTSVITFISTKTSNNITWAGKSVGSIVFNGVGGGWTFLGASVINGNFQMDAGQLTAGSSAIAIGGSWTINGGTMAANTSTLTFSGATAQIITSGGQSFFNLTVTNASAAGVTFADAATVSDTFTDTTNSSKLTFNSGSTYTFNAVNIAANNASQRIVLQASGVANWIFIPATVVAVDYVDVSRSTDSGVPFCATNSNDSGGNVSWHISSNSNCHDDYTYTPSSNWYNSAWSRRKPIVVYNNINTVALSNYQVEVSVPYDSAMQANFNDIIFTDSDGTTLLSNWLEAKTDSVSATYWVKVPSIAALADKSIYMYYGNASVTSSSDGKATFEERGFDNFESYNTGSLLGQSQTWTEYASNPIVPDHQTWVTVLKDETQYKMYYSLSPTNGIGLETSADGKTWVDQGQIMSKGTAGNWDSGAVWVPMVWKENGTYQMMYSGINGTVVKIGHATSADGISWTKDPLNPVFTCPAGTWCNNDTEGAAVIKVGSTYYMWVNTLENGQARESGLATSTDLVNWSLYQSTPIFTDSRFCGSTFKYGDYYYVLMPHYTIEMGHVILELYRSPDPLFLPSNREFLRTAIEFGEAGTWNSVNQDTPFVLTDDIYRNSFNASNNQLWAYFAGQDASTVWRSGMTIEPNIEAALTEVDTPQWNRIGGTISVESTTTRQGSRAIELSDASPSNVTQFYTTSFTPTTTGAVGAWMRTSNTTAEVNEYLYGWNVLAAAAGFGNTYFRYWDGSYHNTSVSYSADTWYLVMLEFNTNTQKYNFVVKDTNLNEIVRQNNISFGNVSGSIDATSFYTGGAAIVNGYVDNFRLRQYSSPEPAAVLGAEENYVALAPVSPTVSPSEAVAFSPSNSTPRSLARYFPVALAPEKVASGINTVASLGTNAVVFNAIYDSEQDKWIETTSNNEIIIYSQLPKFRGTTIPNGKINFYFDGNQKIYATTTADANGNWEYQFTKTLSYNQHTISATVTDKDGNVSERTDNLAFTIKNPSQMPLASKAGKILREAHVWWVFAGIAILILIILVILHLKNRRKRLS